MEIVLSTRNPSKVEQIRKIFSGLPAHILTLDNAGVLGEAIEDGRTLEENALKKASFAREKTGKWSIADDTGIFIDALNGEPGVYSARWAGEKATTEEIMRFTLEKMKDVLPKDRFATFKTIAAVVSPTGEQNIFEGRVDGCMLTEPRCECQRKMPYSAIFVPDGQTKVWAELLVEEENAISHRGKAFALVRDFFVNTVIKTIV